MNSLNKYYVWKVQLTIAIDFISFIYNKEKCVMHSKSDNTEIMNNDEADDVIKELDDAIKNKNQLKIKSNKITILK